VPYLDALDIGNDLLRIYSISEASGESETVIHGTFLVSTPETDKTDRTTTGTAQLYSLLLLLQWLKLADPLTLPAGTNAVNYAISMVQAIGLPVVADRSSAKLNDHKVYDSKMNHLEVVNDLLEFAGFRSLGIDGMGNALMRAYRDPSELAPSIMFRSGESSTFSPQVKYTRDVFDIPNRLRLICSRPDEEPMIATAVNDDPNNRYSTVSRGEVIDADPEEVKDVPSQAALEELAKSRLMSKTSAVESLDLTHTYEPFDVEDGCSVEYGDLHFSGVIISSDTTLQPGMLSSTKIRRFVRF
jgi:hypothetical protein